MRFRSNRRLSAEVLAVAAAGLGLLALFASAALAQPVPYSSTENVAHKRQLPDCHVTSPVDTPDDNVAQEVKHAGLLASLPSQSDIKELVLGYFTSYYRSLEQLSVDPGLFSYVAETDETYLYLRVLDYNIEWRKEVGAGVGAIADSRVESVDVKYMQPRASGTIRVVACVTASFRYVLDESCTRTLASDLWDVDLGLAGGTWKIVSLDSEASDYRWPKGLVAEKLKQHGVEEETGSEGVLWASTGGRVYTKRQAIDEAYNEMCAWMRNSHRNSLEARASSPADGLGRSSMQPDDGSNQSPEGISTLGISVPYDAFAATVFAWVRGGTYDTGIFHNMEDVGYGDCTNFVSQCLWVGYGGPNGNDWSTEAGKAACRLLAWQNFRQIPASDPTPWWGASQYNPQPRLAANDWMRVEGLYAHVQTNSRGPRGTHHNSGRTYYHPQGSTLAVAPGNVLQLDQTGVAPYYHSVIVVSSSTTLGHPEYIYVAQHSANYGWRQLADVIYSNGCDYVRMLRMLAGSFNN